MLGLSEAGRRRLAYGFWRYGENDTEAAAAMLSLARGNGIDHLDTADIYGFNGSSGFGGAETMLGKLRRQAPSLFAGAFIATKAGCEPGTPYNSSVVYLTAACDASLARLGVERIDLFYVHRPDLLTHPHELAEALDGLVAAGKVAAVGVSNFTASQIAALTRHLRAPLVAHQVEFSAAHIAPLLDGTLDCAMERGMAVAAWSPLARGGLGEGGAAGLARVREVLARIAEDHDLSPAAVAIAFLQRHPAAVTPILGTKTPERLRQAMAAATVSLTRAEWYAILVAARGERMP